MSTAGRPILVIGSANMDLSVCAAAIPGPGETVLGANFAASPGGKGANQAAAAGRLGGDVRFAGRVGSDPFGAQLRVSLEESGVDCRLLDVARDVATGVALITVSNSGENAITVAAGANGCMDEAAVALLADEILDCGLLLMQLEIPLAAVRAAAGLPRRTGSRFILNPAPYNAGIELEWLSGVSLITPNEHEAAALLKCKPADILRDPGAAAAELRRLVADAAIITLGSLGYAIAGPNGVHLGPGMVTNEVDTTAAGDCFNGALAVALSEGAELYEAAHWANEVAAISVTRHGAQASLPWRSEAPVLVRRAN
ncbi:MAG: ribokinase [Armatimonadetes bacterium]|nr:ribokinase [Armatimonadota bacterium]MDE2205534.1 ribokinase [Armatimonadota bacterium]